MKAYFQLTVDERVSLSDQDLSDSIRLEAINRGISPPLLLSEEIQRGVLQAYSEPVNSVRFYEVMRPGRWGQRDTGLVFSTEDDARRACIGSFSLEDSQIVSGEFSVRCVSVNSGGCRETVRVEEYEWDKSKYDAVLQECLDDLRNARQKRYDAEILRHKKAEYLRLAKGDEAIARGFWARTEIGAWPEEEANDSSV